MSWTVVANRSDVDALLTAFGSFHDACLRECHVWTGHWVGDDLAMAINTEWDTRAMLLVQRQARPVSAVELFFEEVRHFHLAPSPPNYASEIFSALLLIRDDGIYWADRDDWSPDEPYAVDCTWIHAGKLRWRDAPEWMGRKLRYGPDAALPQPHNER